MATKKIDKEEVIKMQREKELKILKAQNEMMKIGREKIENMENISDLDKMNVLLDLENAEAENEQINRRYGVSEESLKDIKYNEPSEWHKKKYAERLKRKGITDAQLHMKNSDESADDSDAADLTYNESMNTFGEDNDISFNEEDTVVNDKPETIQEKRVITKEKKLEYVEDDNFDISSIPDYIQYDILPLPSDGQCYKNKKSRIPVAYLTASDENLITSPNLYRDGKIMDLLLKRKILDKSINPDLLCKGDRDAILIWLRATGYGIEFPIRVHDPELNTDYDTTIELDKIKTKPFKLTGDENGWFEYKTKNGDVLKFKYINRLEELELQKKIRNEAFNERKNRISEISKEILNEVKDDVVVTESEKAKIVSAANIIKAWGNKINTKGEYQGYGTQMTESMIAATMSVNGNEDREYIRQYIENMRAREAYDYRDYINENEPGMDLKIKVNRPQSLGGGSFDTFLEIDSFIFLSIA